MKKQLLIGVAIFAHTLNASAQATNAAQVGSDLARQINQEVVAQMSKNSNIDLGKPPVFGSPISVVYAPRENQAPVVLAVVEQKNKSNAIAAQVGVSVLMSVLGGGISVGGTSFKKEQLAGEVIADAKDTAKLLNPSFKELPEKLAKGVDETVRNEFSTEKFKGQLNINPDAWKLVYDQVDGDSAEKNTYRLYYGATVYRGGKFFLTPKQFSCHQVSEAKVLSQWRENDYQAVSQVRDELLNKCIDELKPNYSKMVKGLVD